MTMDDVPPPPALTENTKSPRLPKLARATLITRDLCATFIWIYIISKLFIADFDAIIIARYAPGASWILYLRLPALLFLLSIAYFFLDKRHVFLMIFYVVFFPFIVTGKLIYKMGSLGNWVGIILIINTIISVISSLRYHVASKGLYLFCAIFILFSQNIIVTYASASCLVTILLYAYIRHFVRAGKMDAITEFYKTSINAYGKANVRKWDDSNPLRLIHWSDMSPDQIQLWRGNLESTLLANRICLFFARALQDYHSGRMAFFGSVGVMLWLWVSTVVTFGFVYYALYVADPSAYSLSGNASIGIFLKLSLKVAFFGTLPGVLPVSELAVWSELLQNTLVFLCGAVFIALLITARTERISKEFVLLSDHLQKEGDSISELIKEQFNVRSPEEAIDILRDLKSNITKLLLFLTPKDIDK